jgi:S1-C subfamily serine protease
MDLALLAFRKLVAIACADGELDEAERALLERYRRRLRLPAGCVPLDGPASDEVHVPAVLSECPASERAHVVAMLARVALADGRLAARERRRIEIVAAMLEVGPLQLADLLVHTERDAERRHAGQRLLLGIGAGLSALLVASFAMHWRGSRAAEPPASASLKDVEREASASVLLLRVRYALWRGAERRTREGWGTGFFVTPDGHLVTNAHVLEPWRNGEPARLAEDGWTHDPGSVAIAAWPAGAPVDAAHAFTTEAGTLALVRLVAPGETLRKGRTGADPEGDLALLLARVPRAVRALPLCTEPEELAKLDPVLLLGFPQGKELLEGGTAETSPSLGEVRKVEETLLVTTPIVQGNSGSPVLDARGRVVGVARGRIGGEATLCRCVLARHVLPLLPPSAELLASAEQHLARGEAEAALRLLELCEQRGASGAEAETLATLRDRLGRR